MNLGKKLYLGFGTVLFLLTILAGASSYFLITIKKHSDSIHIYVLRLESIRKIRDTILVTLDANKAYVSGNTEKKFEYQTSLFELEALSEGLQKIGLERDSTDLLISLHAAVKKLEKLTPQLLADISVTEREAIEDVRTDIINQGERLHYLMNVRLENVQALAEKAVSQGIYLIIGTSFFSLLLSFLLAYYLTRTISEPVQALTLAAQRISQGSLTEQINITSKDEIGLLSQAFDLMVRNLQTTTVSKGYVDNILASMADSLIVFKPDGTIRSVNQTTLDLLGYKDEELIGMPLGGILAEEEEEEEEVFKGTRLEWLVEKGFGKNLDVYFRTKSGEQIPMSLNGSVMYESTKEKTSTPPIIGIVTVAKDMRDINELLEKERELTAAASAAAAGERKRAGEMEQFAYAISHDLNEPLRGILSFSQLLAKRSLRQLDEKSQHYLDVIHRSASRMKRLIHDLLRYSRIGHMQASVGSISLDKVIKGVVEDLETLLKEKHVDLKMGSLPMVACNRMHAQEILQNLIANAVKYNDKKKPMIEVGLANGKTPSPEGMWTLFVKDNGMGIASDYHKKIFGLFERLERDEIEGTGVGLALVKRTVEEYGGTIWVESELSVGTTFFFTLKKGEQK